MHIRKRDTTPKISIYLAIEEKGKAHTVCYVAQCGSLEKFIDLVFELLLDWLDLLQVDPELDQLIDDWMVLHLYR